MELCQEKNKELAQRLWVKIREKISMSNVAVVASYRLCDQEEEIGEAAFSQVEKASGSQILVLMKDLNHHPTFRKCDPSGFLEYIDDHFLA